MAPSPCPYGHIHGVNFRFHSRPCMLSAPFNPTPRNIFCTTLSRPATQISPHLMSAMQRLHTALFPCLGGPVRSRTPAQEYLPPAPNRLNGLPAQLIHRIIKLLPPVDLFCLSLCCYRLYAILAKERKSIAKDFWQELPILQRLDRDIPDRFLCYRCRSFHKSDELQTSRLELPFRYKKCVARDKREPGFRLQLHADDSHEIFPRLYFSHLELVMKQVAFGPKAAVTTDSLFAMEVRRHRWHTTLSSREAKICSQPRTLCLRIQDIIAIHGDPQCHEVGWNNLPLEAFRICRHEPNGPLFSLMKGLEEVFFGENGEAAVCLADSCKRCNTHYVIELCEFGRQQHAFVITRWIDLGSADMSTVRRWTIHTAREAHTWDLSRSDMQVDPRVAFETASGYNSLDDLRYRNLGYLRGRNYRRIMKRKSVFSSVWSLQGRKLS